MNALIAAVFPYVSCGPIPGAFLNSGPVTRCFFFLFRYFAQKQRKTYRADIYLSVVFSVFHKFL